MKVAGHIRAGVAIVLGCAMLFGFGALGALEPTTAAWSDKSQATAVATAGTWKTTTASVCVAYGHDGTKLNGCVVTGIRFDGWGTPGAGTRNYYVDFTAPSGTKSVVFDVDLSTGKGAAASWSWANAGVLSGGQFAAAGGWNCGALPRVQGRGADWQVTTIYFQVVEQRTGASTLCR